MAKNLIIILGPTGIGKTDLSIQVAQHFDTEIISSDSRQIYKELKIGTAVPEADQLSAVKHHFIQSHSIHQYYNASMYETEVLEQLKQLYTDHNTVVMTGGSMLYIDVVCNGIDDLPHIDQKVRDHMIQRYEREGLENLRLELKKIDPEYYSIVDLRNYKRILRALEVFYMTGKKFSSFRTNIKKKRDFNIVKIGLNMDRSLLHERINRRVDQMISKGLIDEAHSVYEYKHLNSLNTVGYKELFSYFDQEIDQEKAIELIKRNSRRYARRQITWFNKYQDIHWFEPTDKEQIIEFLKQNISNP